MVMVFALAVKGIGAIMSPASFDTVVPAHCSEPGAGSAYLKILSTLFVPPAGSVAIAAPAPLVPKSVSVGAGDSSNVISAALPPPPAATKVMSST